MRNYFSIFFPLSLVGLQAVYAGSLKNGSIPVHPFEVDLLKNVPRMLSLIRDTRLPEKPEYAGVGGSFGIDLDVLKSLQNEWIHEYDWQKDQSYMNRYMVQVYLSPQI